MKITKTQLKQIIKEELGRVLNENDSAKEKAAIRQVMMNAQAYTSDTALDVRSVKKQMERILGREVNIENFVSRHEPVLIGNHEEGFNAITAAASPTGVALYMDTKSKPQYSATNDPESAAYGL